MIHWVFSFLWSYKFTLLSWVWFLLKLVFPYVMEILFTYVSVFAPLIYLVLADFFFDGYRRTALV